ncbi:glycogenin-1-like [Centruroides sculpturatus]|uniref:glycogenin-1-like n=1 Tax=Centruroides sculpturatus TaxID=218467 RepID=UPI000C6E785D|nr:glycogenin-1-like [Centruroides sculpturatus]
MEKVVNQAFVTFCTDDAYAVGALVLGHSLQQVNTSRSLVCLITAGVSMHMRSCLSLKFDIVREVDLLSSGDDAHLSVLERPELSVTFTKLQCWRLIQFNKCVFLDADTMVLQNCDELFEKEELSAVADVGWPDCFNSGVFVFKPSEETYKKLVHLANEKGSFDGGDQGLLNTYFSNWAIKDIHCHLSFIYNMNANAMYTYMPAYKQFGKNVKIVHFLGSIKPWMHSYNEETKNITYDSDSSCMQEHLDRWWQIFITDIQPLIEKKKEEVVEFGSLEEKLSNITINTICEEQTFQDNVTSNKPHSRQYAWEQGQIDYLGIDAYENIEKKLDAAIKGEVFDT